LKGISPQSRATLAQLASEVGVAGFWDFDQKPFNPAKGTLFGP
jgi:hypothetical protein